MVFQGRPPALPPGFSHAQHAGLEGLDCSVCHKQVPDSALPTLPKVQACLLCHRTPKREDPLRPTRFYDENGDFLASRVSRLPDEVLFDHRAHVASMGGDDVDCRSCHASVVQGERVGPQDAFTMADCTSCHEQRGVKDECSVCHTVISRDWEPENHAHSWIRAHGPTVRADLEQDTGKCTLCHTQSSCIQCHEDERPANHDEYWRIRGHAIPASMDRQSCRVCHRDDYCNRCHMYTEPLWHTASFGTPKNDHCLGCHFPLPSNGCFVCHKGTPSHQTAPPKPPNHNPAMDCRACHGQGAPLMHADDGSNCNFCHQ